VSHHHWHRGTVEQILLLELDQSVELGRLLITKPKLIQQVRDHCLRKGAQSDRGQIRFLRPGLLSRAGRFVQIRPKPL